MSEMQAPGPVPEWDQSDRMRKALRVADISVAEIAEYLDVARNTVSTWINGHIEPSTQTLRLWALRTGVPYEWLKTGETGSGPTGPGKASHDAASPGFSSTRRYPGIVASLGDDTAEQVDLADAS